MPWPGGCGAMRPLCALLVVLIAATCAWALAAGTKIEKIEVRGLRRMTVDAFIFASGLKVGQDKVERRNPVPEIVIGGFPIRPPEDLTDHLVADRKVGTPVDQELL